MLEGGSICFDRATGTITDCDKSVTRADIPEKIDGADVTAIGELAFGSCIGLTSVTIPARITNIGACAFYGCEILAAVYFDGDAPILNGSGGKLTPQNSATRARVATVLMRYIENIVK